MLMLAVFPSDTTCEKPTFSLAAQSNTALQSREDMEMNATVPSLGSLDVTAKLALRCSLGTNIPRLLGPRILIPSKRRHSRWIASSKHTALSSTTLVRRCRIGARDRTALHERMRTPRMPKSPHFRMIGGMSDASAQATIASSGIGQVRASSVGRTKCGSMEIVVSEVISIGITSLDSLLLLFVPLYCSSTTHTGRPKPPDLMFR